MGEVSELTTLRQIRLEIQRHRKAIADLEERMDDILEVTSTRRPVRRKTISAESAAALIREGKLRERLST
jgi:hypothetical protein|uniref:Uncharacterized protein n=1 Tax=Siphoviridae sp. ct8Hx23 TaxID=2825360 RepID=A0A8S5P923_9CAUD|nr:MAG TPA: hypothetical protein [Siphoviridae sp. ct8Hx23]